MNLNHHMCGKQHDRVTKVVGSRSGVHLLAGLDLLLGSPEFIFSATLVKTSQFSFYL